MEKYTIEEIHYNLDIAKDSLSEKFVSLVCKALTYLDKKIADKVSDKILFISSDIAGASYIPLKSECTKDRKAIIFLSEFILKNEEKEILKDILHEVAHFYLKHKINLNLAKEEINKQEQEAETLAIKWTNQK